MGVAEMTTTADSMQCVLLGEQHHELSSGVRGLLDTAFGAVFMVADETSLIEGVARLQPALVVLDLVLAKGDLPGLLHMLRTRAPEFLRRTPHGASSVTFWSSMRGNIAIQTLATILGQHVRVGNEDNIWDMHRKRWSTPKQIEWAVRQSEQFGRKVATADEARKIMKVGVWYDTVEETLMKLGLPPNRPEGYKGFLTYDTDGRLPKVAGARTNPVSIL